MIEIRTETEQDADGKAAPIELPEQKREPLFSIDGVEYSYRTEFLPNEGLTYLRIIGSQGTMLAIDWALMASLGAKGYRALRQCEHLTQAQLDAITTAVLAPLLGTVEDPKG